MAGGLWRYCQNQGHFRRMTLLTLIYAVVLIPSAGGSTASVRSKGTSVYLPNFWIQFSQTARPPGTFPHYFWSRNRLGGRWVMNLDGYAAYLRVFACLGNDHKRHRKVMLPAFGRPESRAFLPLFCGYAAQERISSLITLPQQIYISYRLAHYKMERHHCCEHGAGSSVGYFDLGISCDLRRYWRRYLLLSHFRFNHPQHFCWHNVTTVSSCIRLSDWSHGKHWQSPPKRFR